MTTTKKTVKEAVREHFKDLMTGEFNQLCNLAHFDLMYGPYTVGEIEGYMYPGFEVACKQIADKLGDITTMYVDVEFGEVLTSEPQAEEIDGEWCEPYWEAIYQLEAKEVKQILLGRELADYI